MLNAPLGLSCCFSSPPFAQGEELCQGRADSTSSASRMTRRIPPLIEDRLLLLGRTHEIPLSDLYSRLERLIELNPLTGGYLSWMGLVDEIEVQIQPYIRARAFLQLATAVGIEFELQDPYVLE